EQPSEGALRERLDLVVDASVDRPAMFAGVRRYVEVLDLDLFLDDDARVLLGAGSVLDLEVRPHVLEELTERDRLLDVLLRARAKLLVLLERLVARLARHDDEGDVLEDRIFLQLVADRKAVHPRKLDRQQDEIGLVRRGGGESRVAVIDDLGGEAKATE